VMCGARTDCLWRMARDLEESGFDVSLQPILWTYNSGFPKALDISKAFDKAAFREWLDSIDHGLTDAEVRKATSAAVNGAYVPSDGAKRKRGDEAFFGSGFDGQSRFWEPLFDEQKLAVWKDYSVKALREYQKQEFAIGPDHQDLSLPPGVRVKVGEHSVGIKDGAAGGSRRYGYTAKIVAETAPSVDAAKDWAGWKSHQLKPAFEFIIVARKPMSEKPICENIKKWDVGGYNIGAARIPFSEGDGEWEGRPMQGRPAGTALRGNVDGSLNREWSPPHPAGRFPANLISSGGAMGADNRYYDLDRWAAENGFDEDWVAQAKAGLLRVPKPSKREKEAGLNNFTQQLAPKFDGGDFHQEWANNNAKEQLARNDHPTCKPVALFGWLLALGCPRGGLMLDPFVGSGSSLVSAVRGGWRYIGIDQDEHYCEIAEARAAYARNERELAKSQQRRLEL